MNPIPRKKKCLLRRVQRGTIDRFAERTPCKLHKVANALVQRDHARQNKWHEWSTDGKRTDLPASVVVPSR